jgi:hypothetical protein
MIGSYFASPSAVTVGLDSGRQVDVRHYRSPMKTQLVLGFACMSVQPSLAGITTSDARAV